MVARLSALLVALAASACGTLVPTGTSVQVDDVSYFISPFSQGQACDPVNLKQDLNLGDFIPVTVVAQTFSESSLHDLFATWSSRDDVWQPGFLETILLREFNTSDISPENRLNISSTILTLQNADIPSGPYFLRTTTGTLHQAFRLYEDFAGAFTESLLQRPDGRFQTLSAQIPASASITIGVPSRLYFTPSKEKPLAGVRVGVKDIFALAGVKRSNGNRAWYGLYPPANQTATAIQSLIDAGAIIVGLQKLSQFANGEAATADWVDYHAPFNPRGDGYQDTSSSSAGAGASVASYEWLDLAIGSDTGGSIRGPAGVQGLFGNRPTRGLVSLDNVMPLSPVLDTAGFLARDPEIWDAANAALYGDNYTSYEDRTFSYPRTLYALGLSTKNDSAALMQRKFVSDLAQFLNTSITTLDLETEWATSGPLPAKTEKLTEFFNYTYAALIAKDQAKLVRDPFYRDYAAAHDGRRPFINPVPLARWTWADSQSDSIYDEAVHNKTVFMNWFNKRILPADHDRLTCSSGFLLHIDSSGSFSSRNQYLSPPGLPFGFSNAGISIFSEAPDSVFPLGQVPVFSSVTNHVEFLPVTIDVIAARGCDGLIAKLAKDLVTAGVLNAPSTGSGLDGGSILLRRDYRY
ncbi:hypothetical protein CEP52_016648 [Fusarium oligoseptatum]|uniref:Uncharacterized protein n=1 Tax=Fusarium oligoseptatum TaxID=2604345 RepID=A0A428S1E1_9HYPO|nr:hypothetical protein CEP52_016648 [Fusarium oligoseptatum]